MLKSLANIGNKLDSLGLTREADLLDSILRKLAVPIEGIVGLHPQEPLGLESEDKGDSSSSSKPIERINRRKNILRDRRSRERLKYEMSRSRLPLEEQEEAELDEWYGSLQSLGDSIILIPFDKDEIEKETNVLMGLGAIFGIPGLKDYNEVYRKKSLIIGHARNKTGNLEILKRVFPSLWADIQEILNSKNLGEEDVVYMFYNQDHSPDPSLKFLTKDPFYLSHDLGHAIFDETGGRGDTAFKDILNDFLIKALKLYRDEKTDKTAFDQIKKSLDDNGIMGLYLAEFFSSRSGSEDIYADIFSDVAGNRLNMASLTIPDFIYASGLLYNLDDRESELTALLESTIAKLREYVNPNVGYGTFAPGPLSDLAGSVVLQDL